MLKRRRNLLHVFSATFATASTFTTQRTVPRRRSLQTLHRTPPIMAAAVVNGLTATSVRLSVTGKIPATMTKPSEFPLAPSA